MMVTLWCSSGRCGVHRYCTGLRKLWQSKIHLQLLVIQKFSNLTLVIRKISNLVLLVDIKVLNLVSLSDTKSVKLLRHSVIQFQTFCHLVIQKFQTLCHLVMQKFQTLCHLVMQKFQTLCHLVIQKVSKLVSLSAACSSRQFNRANIVLQIEYTLYVMFHVLCGTMQTPVFCCSTILPK